MYEMMADPLSKVRLEFGKSQSLRCNISLKFHSSKEKVNSKWNLKKVSLKLPLWRLWAGWHLGRWCEISSETLSVKCQAFQVIKA